MTINEYRKLAMTTLSPSVSTRKDVLQMNIDKLKKRYPDGFETERSQIRLSGDI